MYEANESNFKDLTRRGVVLVDFWASWCGPCKSLSPILYEIASETNKFDIVKVNVDDNPALAGEYQIMSVPTLLIMKDGFVMDKLYGFQTKQMILDRVTMYL